MLNLIKKYFKRAPLHDRELYVLRNGIAFVKCKRCGAESIPWRVPVKEAIAYNERYPESLTELYKIDKTKTGGACRD
jgi:hypothetical protein